MFRRNCLSPPELALPSDCGAAPSDASGHAERAGADPDTLPGESCRAAISGEGSAAADGEGAARAPRPPRACCGFDTLPAPSAAIAALPPGSLARELDVYESGNQVLSG